MTKPEGSPDPFLFLKRWPWEKILIWSLFVGLLAILHDFLTIFFLTFILTYVLRNVVFQVCRWFRRPAEAGPFYRSAVVGVFALFIGLLAIAGSAVLPRLQSQAEALLRRGAVLAPLDRLETLVRDVIGNERFVAVEESRPWVELAGRIELGERDAAVLEPLLRAAVGEEGAAAVVMRPEWRLWLDGLETDAGTVSFRARIDDAVRRVVGESEFSRIARSPLYEGAVAGARKKMLEELPRVLGRVGAFAGAILVFTLHFFLSVVFSLIILLDLPKLREKVHGLSEGRLAQAYGEIAPSLAAFGNILGRALQAQLVIALVNTALTFIGLFALGVESPVFLSAIVFVCSFVPVAGAIVSSIPIGLMALQQPGGSAGLLLQVVVLILVIHIVEAYFLNPKILGDLLKIHPLIVLLILLVAEHFFGIWGLLLGVPVAYYVFTRFIVLSQPRDES